MSAARPPERPSAESRRERIAREVSAYPGTITFNDLIRKNKRQSVVLIVCMLLLCLALGAAMGAAAGVYAGGGELTSLLPSVAIGAGAAFLFGGLGAMWSWFSGSDAILRMMGAIEIEKGADPELFNVVDEMRIAAGLPMPRVYLINDTALNAFATGRDPEHGVVAVTRGLREKLTRDELQAVVAHEMAHIRHFDIRFAMLMATMVGLIVFACDAFWRITFRAGRYGGGRRSGGKSGGGGAVVIVVLVLAVLLAILAPIVARFIQMAYSREREYLADAGAVELTRNPLALAGALSRIAGDDEPLVEVANRGTAHMFIANPLKKAREAHQNINSLFSSHPPMDKRIARILALTR
ncbi:MAG: M48 family metallopeptidase [Phycisphaerales bacterium]|nr:M48 family metallopeptidase [Phycisphaerales bacterium]